MPSASWTDWTALPLAHGFSADSLRESLDGGQAFRWNRRADTGAWFGVFGRNAVELRVTAPARLEFRAAGTNAGESARPAEALRDYLGMAEELPGLLARLPLTSDERLAAAVRACPGLILLRQDFGEALLGFICSSTKQIVQIKQIAERLAAAFGDEIAPGIRALPTWERLARASEKELRACALGFRARYVHDAARRIAAEPGWLARVPTLPYAEAKAALLELPGVGEKVADCVLLFGARKPEAFPVDVWILRALAENYGLTGWKPAQLAQFGRVHFGPLAGLAQQYLFAAARLQGQRRD